MGEEEFWACPIAAFFRLLRQWSEEQARQDFRAYFAASGMHLETFPKPWEVFGSLAHLRRKNEVGSGDHHVCRPEEWPADWDITLGKDAQQLMNLAAAESLRRMGASNA